MRRRLDAWARAARWRHLQVEAALYLLVARLVLGFVPFRRLAWFFERSPGTIEVTGIERERLRMEVRRAIYFTAGRLPGKTACFPRAIAAQAMLRRRRVGTVLYYGAATLPGRGLTGHVWVQDGDAGVVGYKESNGYHILARYPAPLEHSRSDGTLI